jgi:hypothetical protein
MKVLPSRSDAAAGFAPARKPAGRFGSDGCLPALVRVRVGRRVQRGGSWPGACDVAPVARSLDSVSAQARGPLPLDEAQARAGRSRRRPYSATRQRTSWLPCAQPGHAGARRCPAAARGTGLAPALLQHVVEHARPLVEEICLTVVASNVAACRLYIARPGSKNTGWSDEP